MSLVAIIPARGNSKRLPRKNLLPFNGVPLVVRAIRCARDAHILSEGKLFTEIWCSTDDLEIMAMVEAEGGYCGMHPRNELFIDDQVQTAAVVFEFMSFYNWKWDSFCVLNPTSPLRTPEMLRDAYEVFTRGTVQTESGLPLYKPDFIVSGNGKVHDGLFLFARTLPFLRTMQIIPDGASWLSAGPTVDINTREDFDKAQQLDILRRTEGKSW